MKRIMGLDGLRFIYAMMIVLYRANKKFASYGSNSLGYVYTLGGVLVTPFSLLSVDFCALTYIKMSL